MRRFSSPRSLAAVVLGSALVAGLACGQLVSPSGISLSVDLKDGAKVSDIYLVTAIATSKKGIAKVEFRVDGEPAGSDTSTPYTFEWDTIELDDGEHALTIVARDLEGDESQKEISVFVDNDLAAGTAAHLAKGRDFLAVGNHARAVLEGRKALRVAPDDLEALRFSGDVYHADGKLARAAEYYEQVIAKEPEGTELRLILSKIYVQLSAKELPTEGYRAVMDKAISHSQAAADVAFADLERKAEENGSHSDLYLYGRAQLERGDPETARAKFLSAQRGDLENPLYRNAAAIASIFAGDTRQAEIGFEWLKRRQLDDYLTRCGQGLLELKAHRFDQAKTRIGHALDLRPDDTYVVILAGLAEVRSGDKRAAAEHMDKAIEESPDSGVAHYHLAGVLADRSKFEDALSEVSKCIELDPTFADAHALKGFLFMVKEWAEQIDPFEAAKVSFDIALSLDPESPYALSGAAVWADEQEKDAAMLDYATRAAEADPAEPYIQVVLARAYQKNKELDKMREAMKKAFDADKKNFAFAKPPSSWDLVQMINRFGRRPPMTLPPE